MRPMANRPDTDRRRPDRLRRCTSARARHTPSPSVMLLTPRATAPRTSARRPTPARYSESRRPRDPRERSLRLPRWPSDRSSHASPSTPTAPRSSPMAAARSCRSRCGPTWSRRWPTARRPTARRSWWRATTARRATSPPTCARGSSRGRCASTPAAAWPTSRTSRRRRTSSACAWPRSTPCWPSAAEGEEPPVVVVSAVALSEKVPDPALRPHSFTIRVGDLLDLDEVGQQLVAAGYERVDQVDDRGQFAIRGGILDLYPATEDRAVRIDLFDIEVESIRFFSTFTQRSLGDTEAIEIAPAAELAPEHRELAEIAALEDAEDRPDVAELLPVDRFEAFLDLAADAAILIAAEEDVAPGAGRPLAGRVRRLPRRRRPPPLRQARRDRRRARRARERAPELDLRRPAHRVPRPGRRPRRPLAQGGRARAREARALGLPHRGHVDAPRRRRARRLQPRAPARLLGRRRRPAVLARDAARRLHRRRPAAWPSSPTTGSSAAAAPSVRSGRRAGAAPCARSPTCAPATSSSTRTTASPASPASTRRPSPTSRATTSSSSTRAPTASSCRSTSWRRSPATSARAAATRR